jgi:hypothetical protein
MMKKESNMKGMKIALLCIAAMMIFVGSAYADMFPQHWAKETAIPLWVWNLNWGYGIVIPIQMVFPNIIANPELPPIGSFYGVVSGNRVRWYFEGVIHKPISDLLLCVRGLVFKEQFPQEDGYYAQTGRSSDSPTIPLDLTDQPHIAAWALSADYVYAQPWGPVPLPERGSWNPYYLSARSLPLLAGPVTLFRAAPGIPGGPGIFAITLIDGFQICLVIKLPVLGYNTARDFDGNFSNPLFALILNDQPTGFEVEVPLASGDRIAVQIDILDGHLHNIYLSPTESVVVKYLTPNP